MKKLLLIPIIATSLLTGCNNKNAITINEWLDGLDRGSWGLFAIREENGLLIRQDYDYDFYVAGLIKDNIGDAKSKAKNSKDFENDYIMSYSLRRRYKDFSELFVYVYEDKIETSATAYYTNRNPEHQRFTYELSEESITTIVDGAKKRRQDVIDQNNKDHDDAKESASINNFFKKADEAETKPAIIRRNYYGVVDDKEKWQDRPIDYSFMEDIKGLEYQEKGDDYWYNSYQTPSIVISLDKNTILRIYNWGKDSIADIEYHFRYTYYPYYRDELEDDVEHIGYSISDEKIHALIDKIDAALSAK